MIEVPFHTSVSGLPSAAEARVQEIIRGAVPSVAPALAISVWASGAHCYEACAGWVEPEAGTTPVDTDTLFDLASLTKLFTTTAFLRLASDSGVGLDDAVVSVIPEFGAGGLRGVDGGQEPLSRRQLPTPAGREAWSIDPGLVTFRQLLTHTSGLAPWRSIFRETGPVPPPPDRGKDPVASDERRAAGLAAICSNRFVARPGQEFHYSDLGFMLLGEAASRLHGAPLDVVMRAFIGDPLGLESVTYTPVRAGVPRERIAPTSMDEDWRGRRCWGEVEDENAAGLGGVAGHAGLFATAHEVARFGVAWLQSDPRLRMARYRSAATTDQVPQPGAGRGLGWSVQPADLVAPFGPYAFGHTGFTGTSLVVDPEHDLVVALLTNRVYAGRTHAGIDALRLELHRTIVGAPR